MTMIGTPGLGEGAFAALDCSAVPASVNPVAEVELPSPVSGAEPIRARVTLDHRCCTCNFQGDLRVPKLLGSGNTRVRLSFPAWAQARVAPVTVPVRIK
jgi:hypothetical protein